jgi:hypothetical protein
MAKHRAAKKTTKKRSGTFKPMSLATARRMNATIRRVKKRRRLICKTVCTVCGATYPKGPMTAKKYVGHVKKHHTSKVYC